MEETTEREAFPQQGLPLPAMETFDMPIPSASPSPAPPSPTSISPQMLYERECMRLEKEQEAMKTSTTTTTPSLEVQAGRASDADSSSETKEKGKEPAEVAPALPSQPSTSRPVEEEEEDIWEHQMILQVKEMAAAQKRLKQEKEVKEKELLNLQT